MNWRIIDGGFNQLHLHGAQTTANKLVGYVNRLESLAMRGLKIDGDLEWCRGQARELVAHLDSLDYGSTGHLVPDDD